MRLVPLALTLAACGGPPQVEPERPEPPPPSAPDPAPGDRIDGPLSLRTKFPATPWPERQRAMRRNDDRMVSKAGMRADIAAMATMLERFYPPRAPDQVVARTIAREHHGLLQGLAPYSVDSTTDGFRHGPDRLGICVRPPDELWHCDPGFEPKPADARPAYAISEPAPGIAQLSIHDLSNAGDPTWASFAADAAVLARAQAIVVDLRDAAGTDFRPLLPWLEQVTNRAPLRPLREIHRPASADGYVRTYERRYLPEGRDRAVWATLVGTTPAPMQAPTRPIAIVVGRHCGAACELIARVLETYAGAFVLGGVLPSGRLHRDEPARLTLPSSRAEVFFFATEYRLNPEIEARTGPSHAWTAVMNDGVGVEVLPAALREVKLRLAHPSGWPARCDSLPTYPNHAAMPPAARAKITGEHNLAPRFCDTNVSIELHTDLPISTLRRFLATCPQPPQVTSYLPGRYSVSTVRSRDTFRALSQVAQSELITATVITCEPRSYID